MKRYKLLISIIICIVFILNFHFESNAQIQKGNDIKGEVENDLAGVSLSMPDANTIAIGSPLNNENGYQSGHVRIFIWEGNKWIQKGNNIVGEMANDWSGISVSMPEANIVAIGARFNSDNGKNAGHVRIYQWNGNTWSQKGHDIDGEAEEDQSGWSICMPDANTIAIGSPYNNGNGYQSGHVRIFRWDGINWVKKGSDIVGESDTNRFGISISMPDANSIAVGAPHNSDNGKYAGHVRIFTWNGNTWVQKGIDIDGEDAGDQSGWTVCMPNSNTVAIGAPHNDNSNGDFAGHVRIYKWNGTSWMQKGNDINGEVSGDFSGSSISMPDTNIIAIGAPLNSNNGQIRIYSWNGSRWLQKGTAIHGKDHHSGTGNSVCMPDSNTIALGAPNLENSRGIISIYSMVDFGSIFYNLENTIPCYPNPTDGELHIELNGEFEDATIIIKNTSGKEIKRFKAYNESSLLFLIDGEAGVYYVEIISDKNKSLLKVIKQ